MGYQYDTGLPINYNVEVEKVLSANNTTASVNLFKLTGSVNVKKIYGVLTAKTTLANMTAVSFDLNDSTATVQITKADGVMSTALVGAVIAKQASNATTASINLAATGTIMDGVNSGFYEFVATQKNGANTYLRFTYTTTDAPIACTFKFFVEYESLNGGYLTAV
jgi:hypothetical protein